MFIPIFYRYPKRVLFCHIPKTAGVSIYIWFSMNNWMITNLKLTEVGVGKYFRDKFNIFQLQLEGRQQKNISPQHQVKNIYSCWGDFDKKFAIVRHPFKRYKSELKYQYKSLYNNSQYSESTFEEFRNFFRKKIQGQFEENKSMFDNHIRPQVDFIEKDTQIYKFEDDWKKKIAKDFSLITPPP